MIPNCPIPRWEKPFVDEYCREIKKLGAMWRPRIAFGNNTLDHFKAVAWHACSLIKKVWFPGCSGEHFGDCTKFLYTVLLGDWKTAYDSSRVKGYPIAYLRGTVEPKIREADYYFQRLKTIRGIPTLSRCVAELVNEALKEKNSK